MPKGYNSDGTPRTPPVKQKTKEAKRSYRFVKRVTDILDALEGVTETAHVEACVLNQAEVQKGGFTAHQNYFFRRIQALEAIRDYQRELTPDEEKELVQLNKWFDDADAALSHS